MKIKMTHPDGDLKAGLIYDLPEKRAQEILEKDYGFAVGEIIHAYEGDTSGDYGILPDFDPTVARVSTPRKNRTVKNDSRKNDTQ